MRVRIMKIPLARLDRLSRDEESGIDQGHSDSRLPGLTKKSIKIFPKTSFKLKQKRGAL